MHLGVLLLPATTKNVWGCVTHITILECVYVVVYKYTWRGEKQRNHHEINVQLNGIIDQSMRIVMEFYPTEAKLCLFILLFFLLRSPAKHLMSMENFFLDLKLWLLSVLKFSYSFSWMWRKIKWADFIFWKRFIIIIITILIISISISKLKKKNSPIVCLLSNSTFPNMQRDGEV